MGSDIYQGIQAKHGFTLPPEYLRMANEGFFDLKRDESYLWIPEAEWMPAQQILDYETEPNYKPGFVPFAFTGAGDLWCWRPSEDPQMVVCCIHDEGMGSVDAPNLLGSIYRRILDYASDQGNWESEELTRNQLLRWSERLHDYFPDPWIEDLRLLSDAKIVEWRYGRNIIPFHGLISFDEKKARLAREFDFPRLDEKFEWIIDPYYQG